MKGGELDKYEEITGVTEETKGREIVISMKVIWSYVRI